MTEISSYRDYGSTHFNLIEDENDLSSTISSYEDLVADLPKENLPSELIDSMNKILGELKDEKLTLEEKDQKFGILKNYLGVAETFLVGQQNIRPSSPSVKRLGAGGAAKEVFVLKSTENRLSSHKVFLVARKTSKIQELTKGESRQEELRREVETVKNIRENLQRIRLGEFVGTDNAERILKEYGSIDGFIEAMNEGKEEEMAKKFEDPAELAKLKQWGDGFPHDFELHIDPDLKALGLDGAEGVHQLGQEFASMSLANRGDMESFMRGEEGLSLTLEERMDMTEQVMKAVRDLHAAGYVHGDLKPDNFLVHIEQVDGKRKIRVILNDFGTTELMKPGLPYMGNPRNRSPQNDKSFETDVYAVKNICVRLLEQPHVHSQGGASLITVKESKSSPSKVTIKKDGKDTGELKRQGFERYITEHKDCCQWDGDKSWGKVKVFSGRVSSKMATTHINPNSLKAEQAAVGEYFKVVNAKLTEELSPDYERPVNRSSEEVEATKVRLQNLMGALESMSKTEVKERATMDEAVKIAGGAGQTKQIIKA